MIYSCLLTDSIPQDSQMSLVLQAIQLPNIIIISLALPIFLFTVFVLYATVFQNQRDTGQVTAWHT